MNSLPQKALGIRRPSLFLVPLVLSLMGCPDSGPATPPPPVKGEEPSGDQRARAKAAAKSLGTQLKARLQKAIETDGFPRAIAVCKESAPEVGRVVAAEQGLKVGRTSFKLRNPSNAPPAWAEAWVKAKVEEPSFAEGEDGVLRALLPIRLDALCLTCHGPTESLAPEVKAALAKDYPDDQATGFKEGDLRGWFWVEVPR